MNEFLAGFIGSLIGALSLYFLQQLRTYVRARRGDLTGDWDQEIPATENEPEKKDRVSCTHVGRRVTGTIQRELPENQADKAWEFEGRILGRFFFGIFWAKDLKLNPESFGTLQLSIIHHNQLDGFYVKLLRSAADQRISEELVPTAMTWNRRVDTG